jgi:hypothetical protein
MTATFWLVVAGALWLAAMVAMRHAAGAVKDVDRAQSELFAAERRARFVAAHSLPQRVDTTRHASG